MAHNINLLLAIVFVVFGCVSVYAYLKKKGGAAEPGQPLSPEELEKVRAAYAAAKQQLAEAPDDIEALMEAANQAFRLVRLESDPERQAVFLDEGNAFAVRQMAEGGNVTAWELWGWTPMLIDALTACGPELQEKHLPLVLEHLDAVSAFAPEDPTVVEWWVELLAQIVPDCAPSPFRTALCVKGIHLYERADPRAVTGKAKKKLDAYAATLRDAQCAEAAPAL